MTTLTIDLADLLREKHPHGFHVPANFHVDELIDFADDDWEHDVDVRELLARHRAIALIWDADQVLSHYPRLTAEQAWEVLLQCERNYRGEEGLCWDDIAHAVDEMFPEPARKRYEVRVAVRTLEVYEVEADSEEAARDAWEDGKLVHTDDEDLDSEVLSVSEVHP